MSRAVRPRPVLVTCPYCHPVDDGIHGRVVQRVDHGNRDPHWELVPCWHCNGHGVITATTHRGPT